jgi:hypothetical protein
MHNSIVKVIKHFSGVMLLGARDGIYAAEHFGKN